MKEKDYEALNSQLIAMLTKEPTFAKIYSLNGKSYSGANTIRLWVAQMSLEGREELSIPVGEGMDNLSVWGTFKAWKNDASPIKKGEKSKACIVWNKKEQATDENGDLIFELGGAPRWNWTSFKYPVFHCSQVKGFRESEFISRKEAYQKQQLESFKKKQEEAKLQKTDYLDWVSTQATPFALWSILQHFSYLDECSIYTFPKGKYGEGTIGIYSHPHRIGLCESLKSFRSEGTEGSENWSDDEATDLEVLAHEMVHAVARHTKLRWRPYVTAEGEAIEELVAYFGTVLLFQMFGITKSGFLSRVWTSRAKRYVSILNGIFNENVEEGYVIVKDANMRVNHILKTVFEKQYGFDNPSNDNGIEVNDALDALA